MEGNKKCNKTILQDREAFQNGLRSRPFHDFIRNLYAQLLINLFVRSVTEVE